MQSSMPECTAAKDTIKAATYAFRFLGGEAVANPLGFVRAVRREGGASIRPPNSAGELDLGSKAADAGGIFRTKGPFQWCCKKQHQD